MKQNVYLLFLLFVGGGAAAQTPAQGTAQSRPDSVKQLKGSTAMHSTAETYLQVIDYTWHIRGGLSGINLDGAGNPIPNSTEKDLFSYKLEYETAGQWSGGIGRQSWNHLNGSAPVGIRSYTFTYDPQSRLKTATYSGVGSESYGIPNINYDKNGNITQLQRNGKKGSSFGLMDNLTYTYSGNRLTAVNDAVSGNYEVDFVKRGSGGYTYYANGALKSDENEQITHIIYNTYLNLPEEITLTGGRWIKYTYDGEGKLLKTEYSTGETWEYADGIVFKNGQPYQLPIPDGRAIFESGGWQLEFDYKDHLGNTRASFREGSSGVVQTARTDFDPWGIRLNGTGMVNAYQNRWELQGKEKESTFNLNRINFGARVYNPTIGRWDRVDPLADHPNQMGVSPFAYSFNNPVNFFDPTGAISYPITIRAFAPFNHFGGGFHGDGANRGYTTSSTATARVHQRINFDTDKTSMTTSAWSSSTSHRLLPGSEAGTPTVEFTGDFTIKQNGDAKTFGFGTHVAGSNPMVPGAPNIDVFSDFSITENKKTGILNISGTLKGDNFPSTEAFITDPSGKNVFIGIGFYEGSPFSSLGGTNKRDISSFNFSVTTDKKGNFTGVRMGDKSYSLDDWNKMFQQADPHKNREQ